MHPRITSTAIAIALTALSAPAAHAQDSSRTNEIYHIFDIKTSARRAEVIKALQDGLNPNISNSDSTTPIVMGPPPEAPGRFQIVNPFENSNFPYAAMIPSAQLAQMRTVKCDGAVWISSAMRKVSGSQKLMLTFCLFPYREGYALDIYAIDIKEKGGSLSNRLGRVLGQAIVGNSDGWTNKTILDAVRNVRRTISAQITYVEGQPEFTGTPWEDPIQGAPSGADKATQDTTTAPTTNKGQ